VEMVSIVDVQSQADYRNINIDKVGVKNIRYPITVMDRHNGHQHTVASINMYVNLPRRFKGTHMSRFIEILNEFHGHLDIREFSKVLEAMQQRLHAESAHLEVSFPYFIKKHSPVTHAPGQMEYGCRVIGSLSVQHGYDLMVEVNVPITTVCPARGKSAVTEPTTREDWCAWECGSSALSGSRTWCAWWKKPHRVKCIRF